MKLSKYKCTECGEENQYIGDDIRRGCDCDPAYLVPLKREKRD